MREGVRSRLWGRLPLALLCLAVAAHASCGLQIYNFGGAGRGTKFILPAGPAQSSDPVLQSWVAYSLALSACQLEHGDPLPSSHSSFDCEHRSRKVLVKRWDERVDSNRKDEYLDLLSSVAEAGWLDEYVWVYLRKRSWSRPPDLVLEGFQAWRSDHLRWHRPTTRIIGYWANP